MWSQSDQTHMTFRAVAMIVPYVTGRILHKFGLFSYTKFRERNFNSLSFVECGMF